MGVHVKDVDADLDDILCLIYVSGTNILILLPIYKMHLMLMVFLSVYLIEGGSVIRAPGPQNSKGYLAAPPGRVDPAARRGRNGEPHRFRAQGARTTPPPLIWVHILTNIKHPLKRI